MSDHDHGAYTPSSDRLSFDPREPVRGGGPAPITLIVSGVVMLAIVGAVFVFLSRRPAPQGRHARRGRRAAAADQDARGAGRQRHARRALPSAGSMPPTRRRRRSSPPPPEEPLPRAATGAGPERHDVDVAAAASGRPRPRRRPTTITPPPARPAKAVTIASLTDDAMGPLTAAKAPVKAPPKVTAASAASAAVETTAAAPPPGAGWVQIGAFSSSALAEKGWSDVAALAPAAMSGKGRRVEALSKDGKTLYRAYVTGFASRDSAQAFCDKLKAAGKACFVK